VLDSVGNYAAGVLAGQGADGFPAAALNAGQPGLPQCRQVPPGAGA